MSRAGQYLKSVRKVNGLTLAAFGELVGVSRSYVCDIEKGTRRVHLKMASEWAERLGIAAKPLLERALQDYVDEAGLSWTVRVRLSRSRSEEGSG